MKHSVWNIPPCVPIPEELTRAGYSSLLSSVLASRGIVTAEAAAAFLDCGPNTLEDPFLLTDMDHAVSRIHRAIRDGETVAVYGDYDVDGITAACLLTEYLRGIGLSTEIYIPDRLEEGYGLNTGAIERLHNKNVSLIITVDCGITAVDETDFAATLGVDIIITDHHECQETLPRAVAVVDPKRPDCSYASHDLAGVGVAFKLVCALSGTPDAILSEYADLVAVGTIADVMPLTGENRYITRLGLDKLRRNPREGLASLMTESGVNDKRLTATTIGFTLAPRINAAGRLGRVEHAARLVLERNAERAHTLAAELCDMNRERQELEADIWKQAVGMLGDKAADAPIVLACEGWHQGVIGIAASRLSEAYSVPAIMISLDGEKGKGSCRSYGGFNLFDALSSCGDLLDTFGGHALAAGLNIPRGNVDAFREAMTDYYRSHPPQDESGLTPDVLICSPDLLTMQSVESLDALEPCGTGNLRPTFCITDAELISVTAIGGGKHTSLRIGKFGQVYNAVWFSRKASELGVSAGDRVDIIFYPQISEFRGHRSVQFLLQAMRRADLGDLCREVLTGTPPQDLRLNRAELSRIWRVIDARPLIHTSFSDMDSLDSWLHPAKIALSLRVLSEVQLARVTVDSTELTIERMNRETKANLMDSAAWRNHRA